MSRADQIRAKGLRVSAPASESMPSTVVAPLVRAKPIRTTVDLDPDLHAKFAQWCAKTAPELGRASLPGVEVIRLLLGRLVADEDMQASVIDSLRHER